MEVETRPVFTKRPRRALRMPGIRQLLGATWINEEREHEERAPGTGQRKLPANVKADEERAQRRLFVLQIVQPGLADDGWFRFPRWAPVFAPRFATHNSNDAFLVGLAASAGAGISMGFAEALFR